MNIDTKKFYDLLTQVKDGKLSEIEAGELIGILFTEDEKRRFEKEMQARIDFKMNELRDSVGNTAMRYCEVAWSTMDQKYIHYKEALKMFNEFVDKERDMPTPSNEISEQSRRKKRDKAVDKLVSMFAKPGSKDFHVLPQRIAGIIEDAQRY